MGDYRSTECGSQRFTQALATRNSVRAKFSLARNSKSLARNRNNRKPAATAYRPRASRLHHRRGMRRGESP